MAMSRSALKGKQMLVAGSISFIGDCPVEKLVENNDVVKIDRQSTAKLENVS